MPKSLSFIGYGAILSLFLVWLAVMSLGFFWSAKAARINGLLTGAATSNDPVVSRALAERYLAWFAADSKRSSGYYCGQRDERCLISNHLAAVRVAIENGSVLPHGLATAWRIYTDWGLTWNSAAALGWMPILLGALSLFLIEEASERREIAKLYFSASTASNLPAPSSPQESETETPIEGWRYWEYRETSKGIRLRSVSNTVEWSGTSLTATCPKGHKSPAWDCTCGIYALKGTSLYEVRSLGGQYILGKVRLEGTVIEHEGGYRAERATIIELERPPDMRREDFYGLCGIYGLGDTWHIYRTSTENYPRGSQN